MNKVIISFCIVMMTSPLISSGREIVESIVSNVQQQPKYQLKVDSKDFFAVIDELLDAKFKNHALRVQVAELQQELQAMNNRKRETTCRAVACQTVIDQGYSIKTVFLGACVGVGIGATLCLACKKS